MLFHLEVLDETITKLKEGNSLVASSVIHIILFIDFIASSILDLTEAEEEHIKLPTSELETLRINCRSINNAVEKVAELQVNKLKTLEPKDVLVAFTT